VLTPPLRLQHRIVPSARGGGKGLPVLEGRRRARWRTRGIDRIARGNRKLRWAGRSGKKCVVLRQLNTVSPPFASHFALTMAPFAHHARACPARARRVAVHRGLRAPPLDRGLGLGGGCSLVDAVPLHITVNRVVPELPHAPTCSSVILLTRATMVADIAAFLKSRLARDLTLAWTLVSSPPHSALLIQG